MKKIAFIHYPHGANSARLETMPFALNSVIALARAGWQVDLFLWENPSQNYDEIFQGNVTIKYFTEPVRTPLNLLLRPIQLQLQFQWYTHYLCVFGLGQIGAYIASALAKHNHCPFIYFNDEFPDNTTNNLDNRRWTQLEKKVVKTATMLVVPDGQRFQPLCHELEINTSIPYAELPNVALVNKPSAATDWYDYLKIPRDSIPFLNAGSLSDWSQIPELLSSVPYWNRKAVLILHSRSKDKVEIYRKQLSHLDIPGKAFWSYQPLSEPELNSLVAFCTGNFALYRNLGPNIEYVGFSSGKLMRSLACGSPVIASDLPSLSFVSEHKLGVLVNHPSEISDAIEEVIENRAAYSANCLRFSEEKVSFNHSWQIFCQKFKSLTDIELLKTS